MIATADAPVLAEGADVDWPAMNDQAVDDPRTQFEEQALPCSGSGGRSMLLPSSSAAPASTDRGRVTCRTAMNTSTSIAASTMRMLRSMRVKKFVARAGSVLTAVIHVPSCRRTAAWMRVCVRRPRVARTEITFDPTPRDHSISPRELKRCAAYPGSASWPGSKQTRPNSKGNRD